MDQCALKAPEALRVSIKAVLLQNRPLHLQDPGPQAHQEGPLLKSNLACQQHRLLDPRLIIIGRLQVEQHCSGLVLRVRGPVCWALAAAHAVQHGVPAQGPAHGTPEGAVHLSAVVEFVRCVDVAEEHRDCLVHSWAVEDQRRRDGCCPQLCLDVHNHVRGSDGVHTDLNEDQRLHQFMQRRLQFLLRRHSGLLRLSRSSTPHSPLGLGILLGPCKASFCQCGHGFLLALQCLKGAGLAIPCLLVPHVDGERLVCSPESDTRHLELQRRRGLVLVEVAAELCMRAGQGTRRPSY
mmetsp:Transcript_60975/g.196455  ORF Transcript_60975/g.196455 Transcript_60975/m.196455 type:complete len:294 (+) Transcript_60975:564-1445(+)